MRPAAALFAFLLVLFSTSDVIESGSISSFASTTQGLFDPYQVYEAGTNPFPGSVAIGDVTGDGRNDVLLTDPLDSDPNYDEKLLVFTQTLEGTLQQTQVLSTDDQCCDPMGVATGDLNGDGLTDAAVGTDQGVDVYYQLGGQLSQPQLLPFSMQAEFTAISATTIVDIDGDGDLDIVCSVSIGTFLFRNTGGSFRRTRIGFGLPDVEVRDLTGDGIPEVVGFLPSNGHAGLRVVSFTRKGGRWTTQIQPAGVVNEFGYGIGVGDVDGDGLNDVVLSIPLNEPGAEIRVLLNEGGGNLSLPVRYFSYNIPDPVEIADLNGDGRADVATAHGGWETAGVYLQTRMGTLDSELLYPLPFGNTYDPQALAIGDVNGDGLPDMAIANNQGGSTRQILVVLPHHRP
jgi:serine protease